MLVKTVSSINVIQPNTTTQTASLQKHIIIDMHITICVLFILWHHPKYARNVEGYILCSEGFSLSGRYGTTIKSWNHRWRKQQNGKNIIAKGSSSNSITLCADTLFPSVYGICKVFNHDG